MKPFGLLLFLLPLALASASTVRTGPSTANVSCGSPADASIAFRVALARRPMHLFEADGRLWVALAGRHDPRTGATLAGGSIVEVHPETGRILRTLRLPVDPTQFVAAFGSLWVIGAPTSRRFTGVLRIDPRDGRVIAVIRAPKATAPASPRRRRLSGSVERTSTPRATPTARACASSTGSIRG